MRVHIITNLFAPDELAGAALFTDLAVFLKERGHDVRTTCTFSYYPAWKHRDEDRGVSLRQERYHEIPIRRVAMYVPEKPTGAGRMISDLSFFFSLLRAARHPGWKPDVVLTALPMLSQCLAQRFLYFGRHIPRLIVVQDFVVEAALELKILRLPGLAWALHAIQRWALRSAQTLLTISPLMLEQLRQVVGPDRPLRYVPNWIHASLQTEIKRQAQHPPVRTQRKLLYSGNVGIKQGLPDFLDQFNGANTAELDWQLDIHGGGADMDRLRSKISHTPQCSLRPVLDEPQYVHALLSTSACVVTQRPGKGANFLPSKILPALATGTPVLAVCDPNSPLGLEVREGGFGTVVPPNDVSGLAQTLRQWNTNANLMRAFGARSLERSRLYQREQVLSEYEKHLAGLAHAKDVAVPAFQHPALNR